VNSAGHRANILNGSFRQSGIGVAVGTPTGAGGATYTHDFGRR
jgi:serralysin